MAAVSWIMCISGVLILLHNPYFPKQIDVQVDFLNYVYTLYWLDNNWPILLIGQRGTFSSYVLIFSKEVVAQLERME